MKTRVVPQCLCQSPREEDNEMWQKKVEGLEMKQ